MPSTTPIPPKQTFIPKQSIARRHGQTRARSGGWLTTISVALLVLSIVTYGGLFLYNVYMNRAADNLAVSLERAKRAFEPQLIAELQRVDTRLMAANTLLSGHTALSSLFDILEAQTVKTVRYENFDFRIAEDGTYSLTTRGEADDYASIALQSDIFSDNPTIKNHIFSNLDLNRNGNITFRFSAMIDPNGVRYTAR